MPEKKLTAEEGEGSKAFANGLELSNNPYAPGDLAKQWEQGWKRGKRKAYFRKAGEQDAMGQIMTLDQALYKLAPKSLRRYSESNWVWIRLGGVAVLIGWVFGFGALIVFAAFFAFLYSCVGVFVLVQHFAKQGGDKPWKKVLSYTVGWVIGLGVILIMWELMRFFLEKLETFLKNV